MSTPSFVSKVIRPGSWTSSRTSTITQARAAQGRPARPRPPSGAAAAAAGASRRRPGSAGPGGVPQGRRCSLLPPQDQQQIPREQLAQARQGDEEPAPGRVVARPRLDYGDVGPPPDEGQDLPDAEREHRLPVDVLRLPAVTADVTPQRVIAPQVVEGRGLVAAPRPEPHRVGQV